MKINRVVLETQVFLDMMQQRAAIFKAHNGFGKWLKEYAAMDAAGLFKPQKLKRLYEDILYNRFRFGFVQKQAVYAIGIYAYDDTLKYLQSKEFKILNSDGSDYLDEDGDTVVELSFDEACDICQAINDDALDYVVYIADNETNKFVYQL